MPLPIPSAQPTAYETAYQVLGPSANGMDQERRAVERLPFRFVQRIAAYDGQDRLPDLRFFPVQCHDISRRGIAFLLPGPLDFTHLVVELGSDGERMYFEAEMVNSRPFTVAEARKVGLIFGHLASMTTSSTATLIGCRFEKRLEFPTD